MSERLGTPVQRALSCLRRILEKLLASIIVVYFASVDRWIMKVSESKLAYVYAYPTLAVALLALALALTHSLVLPLLNPFHPHSTLCRISLPQG